MFHFATVYEAVADAISELPAIIQGERTVSWGDFDDRWLLRRLVVGRGHG